MPGIDEIEFVVDHALAAALAPMSDVGMSSYLKQGTHFKELAIPSFSDIMPYQDGKFYCWMGCGSRFEQRSFLRLISPSLCCCLSSC